jgi:hypothetical protein
VEAIPLKSFTNHKVFSFLDQFIITRIGVLSTLVFDTTSYFFYFSLTEFALQKGIKIKNYSNYFPQGNGLAESTNKNLLKNIKKTISDNHKSWQKALFYAF